MSSITNKDEFVLQDFDAFLDSVASNSSKLSATISLNQELNEELDQLHKELQRKDGIILSKDEEIASLIASKITELKSHSAAISASCNDFRASAMVEQFQYEKDSILSQQRAHNREIESYRSENERLLRLNQQLQRDNVFTARLAELERQAKGGQQQNGGINMHRHGGSSGGRPY